MTPKQLPDKWAPEGPARTGSERAGAQPHLMDLRQMRHMRLVGAHGQRHYHCVLDARAEAGHMKPFQDD